MGIIASIRPGVQADTLPRPDEPHEHRTIRVPSLTTTAHATVVIPCFNHGAFVAHAVRSALEQMDALVDIVVVNDGSTDADTPRACDDCLTLGPRVRVIHQPNAGLPAARNRGAREAASEFLVFLDADDWIRPAFVRTLAAALRDADDPSASHAYCQEELVELGTGIWRVPSWDPLLLMITNLHPVTCLVRRDCFERVGGFDEAMRDGYEDWDLWLRFAAQGWRGVRVREPLFVWRRHAPDTMVMRVIRDHESLFRRIVANHPALYDRHARDLLVLSNVLLRRFDANWLDETGDPIPLLALRKDRDERDRLRLELEAARRELDRSLSAHHAHGGVRAARAVSRAIDAFPTPLQRLARRALGALKRRLP